jgi:hypothetical protein
MIRSSTHGDDEKGRQNFGWSEIEHELLLRIHLLHVFLGNINQPLDRII